MNAGLDELSLADLHEGVAAFRGEVSQAIEGLVSGVLALQDDQVAPLVQRVQALERQAERLTALGRDVERISKDLDLERSNRALAEMSRMAPKERTVVFVGRWHFGDNLKYAWLAALERAPAADYECWYLPPDAQQEALVRSLGARCLPCDWREWTHEHFLVAQRTAVLVIADHFFPAAYHPNPYAPALFAGARWVQLWHGISIKEVALRFPADLRGMTPFLAQAFASCGRYAAFVGSSEAAQAEWRRWFAFERYHAVGYPRSDVLMRTPTERDLLNVDLAALQAAREAHAAGGRAVLYAPTFRDKGLGTWLYDAGLDAMAAALAQRGDRLLVNLHPLECGELPRLRQAFPAVHFVAEHTDLYPLLREATLLITDYSSLMFDFLPLRRPMLFYRPDHERYTGQSRPLYADKVKQLPGAACDSLPALLDALRGDMAALDEPYAEIREELAARLFDRIDDQASARVLALIEQELDAALATQA
ncbi:MAG TPA: CDP-glycerol glycerophosphotransferase family protein [Burkholderiaceae bacterium]|nr:CDP-glycerol glycerophosphotransferase family protein [Burkholderiaceae bacterium]